MTQDYETKREALVQALHADAESLRSALVDVKETTGRQLAVARDRFALRRIVRSHPLAWLVGAFVFGFLYAWSRRR